MTNLIISSSQQDIDDFFVNASAACGHKMNSFDQILFFIKKTLEEKINMEKEMKKEYNEKETEYNNTICSLVKKVKKQKEINNLLNEENLGLQELIGRYESTGKENNQDLTKAKKQKAELEKLTEKYQSDIQKAENEKELLLTKMQHERENYENVIRKYEGEIQQNTQKISELKKMINSPEYSGSDKIAELIQENIHLKVTIESQNEQIFSITKESKKYRKKVCDAVKKINQLKSESLQLKEKISRLNKKQPNKSAVDTISQELTQQTNQVTIYAQEIDKLHLNIIDLQNQIQELKRQNDLLVHEKENVSTIISNFESILCSQKDEILELTGERQKFVSVILKQLQIIQKIEFKVFDSQTQIKDLLKKLKQRNEKCIKKQFLSCNSSLLPIVSQSLLPQLSSKNRSRINAVLANSKLNQNQKLQNVIHELAIIINELEENPKVTEQKPVHMMQMIDTIIAGFSNVLQLNASNDQVGLDPSRNNDMINFISGKIEQMKLIIKEAQLMDPQYVTPNIFAGSYEDRKRTIQEISALGWDAHETFDIFCLSSLINIAQDSEIYNLRKNIESLQLSLSHIEKAIGTTDPTTLSENIGQIQKRYNKLKTKNRKLKAIISELQNVAPQEDIEAHQKIVELKGRIIDLNNTSEALQKNMNEANQELEMKVKIISQLEEENSNLKSEIRQTQLERREEIAGFEKKAYEAAQQLREANVRIAQAASENESKLAAAKRSHNEEKVKMASRLEKVAKALEVLKAKNEKLEADNRAREEGSARELERLTENEKILRKKFEESIKAMRVEDSERAESARRMAEDLRAKDERVIMINKELMKVKDEKKALAAQVGNLEDKLRREMDSLRSRMEVKDVAAETRRQEEIAALRVKNEAEKASLITTVLSLFGIEASDEDSIDYDLFLDKMKEIGLEYHRLKPDF